MYCLFYEFCLFFLLGLSELEDLQERYSRLEHLYSEAVKERDEAIEERNKATVLIALQLQTETQELNEQINSLQNENKKLIEENEDLKIRLGYAKDDLNKLQQKHIKLQIEQEQCLQEKEDALALLKELETQKETLKRESNQEVNKQDEEKMTNQQMVSEQYNRRICRIRAPHEMVENYERVTSFFLSFFLLPSFLFIFLNNKKVFLTKPASW